MSKHPGYAYLISKQIESKLNLEEENDFTRPLEKIDLKIAKFVTLGSLWKIQVNPNERVPPLTTNPTVFDEDDVNSKEQRRPQGKNQRFQKLNNLQGRRRTLSIFFDSSVS